MGGDLEPVLLIRCWRQHARLELRSAAHLLGALRDHSLESVQAGPMGHLQAAALKVVDDQQVELRRADRLDVVGEGSVVERGPAELRVVDARDHDHGDVGPGRPQLLEQAVSRLVR